MKSEAKSLEECLEEAAECERLARLARSKTARMTMKLSAAVWRKRAQKRQHGTSPTGTRRSRRSAAPQPATHPGTVRDRNLTQSPCIGLKWHAWRLNS
jgi:hypothetical protein